MCDMFLILKTTSFTDHAEYNTPFVVRDNTTNAMKALEEIGENFIRTRLHETRSELKPV